MWLTAGILAVIAINVTFGEYPQNVYDHSVQRGELKEEESQNSVQLPSLSSDEKIVDHYLQYLKWQEFKATQGEFRPARPIEQEMDNIVNSEVYKALKPLPKGGNMHSHENHELSKETQLRLIYDSDQFPYLYMVSDNSTTNPWTLEFFHNPPEDNDWVRVQDSEYTFEEILAEQTLIGVMDERALNYPSDTGERWVQMGPLWGRGSTQLIANVNIKLLYLEALYNQTMSEGVQYLETRKNFGPDEMLYEIDTSGNSSSTNGKKYLDNNEGELEVDLTLQLIEDYQERFPSFIGHRRIIYSSRYQKSYKEIKTDMERAINLRQKYPTHIIGFDLVAEEDRGNSLLAYLDNFLDDGNRIPLYLHTGETNWPADLLTSPDSEEPVATIENIYDALLLGAKRFGHGLGFIKHPQLLQEIIARGAAVEVCPVSNQILGYVPDLRSHPALTYYRWGVPIVLGADDPGTFGYDSFSIDWYEIFMAWGLTLADLKLLATYSLSYSSLANEEREEASSQKWTPAWNNYIANMKEVACNTSFTANEPTFSRMFPNEGATNKPTTVHIYGRNFERAICKEITCTFGTMKSTEVTYVTNNHIICQAPIQTSAARVDPQVRALIKRLAIDIPEQIFANDESTVEVTVNLGDGIEHSLGNFTYAYEITDPDDGNSASTISLCSMLFISVFFSMFNSI